MSASQDQLSGHSIIQNESKGLLSLLDEIIIRIIEKLSSEDTANIADTCIRLREVPSTYVIYLSKNCRLCCVREDISDHILIFLVTRSSDSSSPP